MKAYRDGYNRTNLDLRLGPLLVHFRVTDEPWEGPTARVLIDLPRRGFVVWSLSWGVVR